MKTLRKALTTLLVGFIALAPLAHAQEITVTKTVETRAPWIPDSAITQHAAYAGYIAAGVGYEWFDMWATDLLYGYTPQDLAGEAVHQWSLKNSIYLFSMGRKETLRVRPYLGLSVIYSPDSDMWIRAPHQYPEGYYPATAIRPALIGGLEFQVQEQLALGLEFAVLDSEISYYTDTKTFDPNRMGSSGLSVRWLL